MSSPSLPVPFYFLSTFLVLSVEPPCHVGPAASLCTLQARGVFLEPNISCLFRWSCRAESMSLTGSHRKAKAEGISKPALLLTFQDKPSRALRWDVMSLEAVFIPAVLWRCVEQSQPSLRHSWQRGPRAVPRPTAAAAAAALGTCQKCTFSGSTPDWLKQNVWEQAKQCVQRSLGNSDGRLRSTGVQQVGSSQSQMHEHFEVFKIRWKSHFHGLVLVT